MHIRKYDFDYSRRKMMQNVALGLGGGVLAPVWPTIAATGEVTKAYPDELTSIEVNTKGKIKVGDTIDSSNVEHVKHLLDPSSSSRFPTVDARSKSVRRRKTFPSCSRTSISKRRCAMPARPSSTTPATWLKLQPGVRGSVATRFPTSRPARKALPT